MESHLLSLPRKATWLTHGNVDFLEPYKKIFIRQEAWAKGGFQTHIG